MRVKADSRDGPDQEMGEMGQVAAAVGNPAIPPGPIPFGGDKAEMSFDKLWEIDPMNENTPVRKADKRKTYLKMTIKLAIVLIAFWLLNSYVDTAPLFKAFFGWLHGIGGWAYILLGLAIILSNMPFVLGYVYFIIGSGFLFGWWRGALTAHIATTTGCWLCFFLTRRYLAQWVVKRLKEITFVVITLKAMSRHAKKTLFLLRLGPMAVCILNPLMAVTPMSFRDYAIMSYLGMLPDHILLTFLGASLRNISDIVAGRSDPLSYAALGVQLFFGVVAFFVIQRYVREQLDEEVRLSETTRTTLFLTRGIAMAAILPLGLLEAAERNKKLMQHRKSYKPKPAEPGFTPRHRFATHASNMTDVAVTTPPGSQHTSDEDNGAGAAVLPNSIESPKQATRDDSPILAKASSTGVLKKSPSLLRRLSMNEVVAPGTDLSHEDEVTPLPESVLHSSAGLVPVYTPSPTLRHTPPQGHSPTSPGQGTDTAGDKKHVA